MKKRLVFIFLGLVVLFSGQTSLQAQSDGDASDLGALCEESAVIVSTSDGLNAGRLIGTWKKFENLSIFDQALSTGYLEVSEQDISDFNGCHILVPFETLDAGQNQKIFNIAQMQGSKNRTIILNLDLN